MSKADFVKLNHILFIANRGEICRRIIKSGNKLGLTTVVPLLPENKSFNRKNVTPFYAKDATSTISYENLDPLETFLSIEATVNLAKRCNATLIHPGYGFLSENPAFVKEVTKAGIIFVGPTTETMERLGSKTNAKWLAKEQQVPTIPGIELTDINKIDFEDLKSEINSKIGFPLIIKASAGGGGRGMRIVKKIEDLVDLLKSATEESYRAFASKELFIEKYIEYGRHIEVQILGDSHGNVIHLYDRDCSVQRKFQKIIEIAPAQNLKEEIKSKLYEAAIKLATSGKLTNAGTFEFLVDTSTDNFYFLEANPRLQVEHTITEEITGVDIVALQLKIALGGELPKQSSIIKKGVSIQARVCGEVPEKNFLPSIGKLNYYKRGDGEPKEGKIRVDLGYEEGELITSNFDSLLQKSISHAKDFLTAKSILIEHLNNLCIFNIGTNIPFLITILNQLDWKIPTTTWLEEFLQTNNVFSRSKESLSYEVKRFLKFDLKQERANFLPSPKLYISNPNFDDLNEIIQVTGSEIINNNVSTLKVVDIINKEDILCLYEGYPILISRPKIKKSGESDDLEFNKIIESPLPGTILKILVKAGDIVPKGAVFVKFDSMKTEHSILSKFDCIIEKVCVEEGSKVKKGSLILEIE